MFSVFCVHWEGCTRLSSKWMSMTLCLLNVIWADLLFISKFHLHLFSDEIAVDLVQDFRFICYGVRKSFIFLSHLSHSVDLSLFVVICQQFYILETTRPVVPFLVWSIKDRSNLNYGTSKICKKDQIFTNLFLYSHSKIKCMVFMSFKPFTKSCEIHYPWFLWRDQFDHIKKHNLILENVLL